MNIVEPYPSPLHKIVQFRKWNELVFSPFSSLNIDFESNFCCIFICFHCVDLHQNVLEKIVAANGLLVHHCVLSSQSLRSVSQSISTNLMWIEHERAMGLTVHFFEGGVACALGGAALGATGLAGPPTSHLTAALLMIGKLNGKDFEINTKKKCKREIWLWQQQQQQW